MAMVKQFSARITWDMLVSSLHFGRRGWILADGWAALHRDDRLCAGKTHHHGEEDDAGESRHRPKVSRRAPPSRVAARHRENRHATTVRARRVEARKFRLKIRLVI